MTVWFALPIARMIDAINALNLKSFFTLEDICLFSRNLAKFNFFAAHPTSTQHPRKKEIDINKNYKIHMN
jgi:hypothetical protein